MALIVEQHVVADRYVPGSAAITAGMLVEFDAAGAVNAAAAGTAPGQDCVGIAGDSKLAAEGQTTAFSDQVIIGADNATTARNKFTENRVSDFYNETLASGLITVYNGGGKFWVSEDLFDAPAGVVAGTRLGPSSATAGEWDDSVSATVADDDITGLAVGSNQAYPSGVPGTDVTGSLTLGNFVPLILRI
jgi:hypothetical protein